MNRKPSLGIRHWLSDNLKRLRAAHCGLHKNYVSNVEQGAVNISLANLEALATGLGCIEWELLT
jgi:transcriptional regulator with XRE-family HTH domain